jgi:hypothetical protein
MPDRIQRSRAKGTDRPIIFSAPMVLALLAGRKLMTRRLATSPLRKCAAGDQLWVRESFATTDGLIIRYAATDDIHELRKRKPAIHMPRWASRLTLTVTGVKIERLQEISEEDAKAEGVQLPASTEGHALINVGARFSALSYVTPRGPDEAPDDVLRRAWTFRAHYAALWDSLHGPGAWEANPEIVAIGFTVEHRNIDAPAIELANA